MSSKPKGYNKKPKKKKLRAPDSADDTPRKPACKDAGREYTADELAYGLSRVELFRQLERHPILDFLKPKLIEELRGPSPIPVLEDLTSIRIAASALFKMMRGSGFVLGVFEMEKVYDWDLSSWKDAMRVLIDPLVVLVVTVETPSQSPRKDSPTPTQLPPPAFLPANNSDSSVESPKRMQMPPGQPQWVKRGQVLPAYHFPQRTPAATAALPPPQQEAPSPDEGAVPKALEDTLIRQMQSLMMRTVAAPAQTATTVAAGETAKPRPATTTPLVDVDVIMESVSSRGEARPREIRRDRDEDLDDLFDLDNGVTGNANAISSATAGAANSGVTRVRLSAFSELKEFHGRDASEEKARTWLNRVKSASRRDGMTGDEVCALFGDLMSGPARQWYLQLRRNFKKSSTELTEQFRIQYCGKGVSMASRYYHAAKRSDETPLEYVYRLNVAGMRAKVHYDDDSAEEKKEHVELFIDTLVAQEQELISRLTVSP